MDEIEYVWSVLGGDAALTARVARAARPEVLEARLPVRALASACVGACALAAAELAARRAAPGGVPAVRVDDGAVAAAFTSERHLRIGGREPVSFAPLSRLWRTADGWVRTHANYPHHRARLLAALGLARDTEDARAVDAVGSLLAGLPARSVEETVYAAGGAAVALRTPEEWASSEQGRAVAGRPLVERGVLDASPARTFAPVPPSAGALLPAAGLRVLDLTRVIAGPVATRTLALLGADVLRVDPPGLPELPDQHVDTGFGKRSATLDLTSDQAAFEELLGAADVVVTGYRPGSLDRFGLSPRALAARRPGLVVARLSAWGAYGPWAGRRGFDSLVQVGTGIAALEGTADRPGALPAQALDHGTGYLLAAGVLRALTEQSRHGGSRYVEVALARTAAWLSAGPAPDGASGAGRPHGVGGSARSASADTGDTGGARGTGGTGGPSTLGTGSGARRVRAAGDAGGPGDAGDAGGPGDAGDAGGPGASPWLRERESPLGRLRYALPPVRFEGGPTDWERAPGPWGADAARWV
ncbi:CoA transferase [Streptomyces rochei]|uniref:CoA transferase n=1 Tax=Streptomyces rochei TaxID=1928 RepID=UPI0036A1A77C